jgi:amino acid adenylation domain-containing protein/non-ribosomal peptide synthase protein (TIGR01720 family)
VVAGEAVVPEVIRTWGSATDLIIGYGPTEATVYCTVHYPKTEDESSIIGTAVSSSCYVVESANSNKLVPIGGVGELLISGPLLSRGYLGAPDHTSTSFIMGPSWSDDKTKRLYCTGDLVRLLPDGNLSFLGRKDNQVKLRGYRIELGEIEAAIPHLSTVLLPRRGLHRDSIVALIPISQTISTIEPQDKPLIAMDESSQELVAPLKEAAMRLLPPYMVPSVWLVVDSLPTLASGKVNRRWLVDWIAQLGPVNINDKASETETQTSDPRELALLEATSDVLNKPKSLLSFTSSFFAVGGDSISAMLLTARCVSLGYRIRVRDILQAKSLSGLASNMEPLMEEVLDVKPDAMDDSLFDLSPIQKLHFHQNPLGSDHFNQSVLLQSRQPRSLGRLKSAIEHVVEHHSMLRSRFECCHNAWQQRISTNSHSSFLFETLTAPNFESVVDIVKEKHKSTNFEAGPMLVVTQISVGDDIFISLICHHLVVDLVSWRIIIRDLEDLLQGTTPLPPSTSYSTWVNAQQRRILKEKGTHHLKVQDYNSNFDYWSLKEETNLNADAEHLSFHLTPETTKALLDISSRVENLQSVDVMVAALVSSFCKIFPDRTAPSVFTEHHGRETWDSSIDLSRTVGWLTTISPITVAIETHNEIEILKLVKNARRSQVDNVWTQFAYRYGGWGDDQRSIQPFSIELLFNFFGLMQQFERNDALFKQIHFSDEAATNYDPSQARLALFEITALVDGARLLIDMSYNRNMKLPERAQSWLSEFQNTLELIVSQTLDMNSLVTSSDFPASQLNQRQLETTLRQMALCGINAQNIEDIYPCAPIQQGILLSQQRCPQQYVTRYVAKISPRDVRLSLDIDRMKAAWAEVVQRHPILRTRFETSPRDGFYHQIVLHELDQVVQVIPYVSEDGLEYLLSWDYESYDSLATPHAVGLMATPEGDIYYCLQASHAIMDAHSLSMAFREFVSLYNGAQISDTTSVPGYREYAEALHKRDEQDDLSYWRTFLEDVSPCHFPALQSGSQLGQSCKTMTIEANIDELSERAASFCAEHDTTIANLVQIVWAILLASYTGTNDVCFGYQTSGRDIELKSDPHRICGPLISTLPSRFRLDRTASIVSMLKQAQDNYASSLAHQHCPLIVIQHDLALAGRSLFNTSVSLARPHGAKSSSEVLVGSVSVYDPTEYICTLNVEVGEGKLGLAFNYEAASIPDSFAGVILDCLENVFLRILDDPQQRLGDLIVAGDATRSLAKQWNGKEPLKINRCVHNIVEDFVDSQPEHQAVCAWDIELTYNELNRLSDALSEKLVAHGVGPETFVPLCFEKSGWHVVAMFAILKAGGACVSLDPSHPLDRLCSIIQQVHPPVVLVSNDNFGLFAGLTTDILVVGSESFTNGHAATGEAIVKFRKPVEPHNAAFVIFTSGSTGKPNGSVFEHVSMATSSKVYGDMLQLSSGSRVLQFSSYAFDLSIADEFHTLMGGGTVCIPSEFERVNDLVGAMRKYRANWAAVTPAVASLLTPADVSSLDILVMGGERMRADTIKSLANHVRLAFIYGPSECSVCVMYNTMVSPETDPANLGHQAGVSLWLVDPSNHHLLAPPGSVGEILVEGPLLAREYLGEPEKTAASFIHDPEFSRADGRPGRRMYKTGDLARYNSDGTLNYIQRRDNQVKIRGNRVELGEIEATLQAHPAVRDALALLPDTGHLSKRLVAVVSLRAINASQSVSREGIRLLDPLQQASISYDAQAVKVHLSNNLPAYMLPSQWLLVEKIPLNSSGKMDRLKALEWLNDLDGILLETYVKSNHPCDTNKVSNKTESTLLQIWESVLNTKCPDARSRSFMSFGGDSLTAMQVVSSARREGINVTVHNVLQCHGLSDLASTSTKAMAERKLPEAQVDLAFPLSPIQTLFFNINSDTRIRCNQSFALKFSRNIPDPELGEAIHRVVQRHSMLRARFFKDDRHGWQQRIREYSTRTSLVSHHFVSSGDDVQPMMHEILASSNFDITADALFASHSIRISGEQVSETHQYLLLVASHLVVDLVSWRLILRDLEDLLAGSPLPLEKPLSFQVWTTMQRTHNAENCDPDETLIQSVPKPDYEFWGMNDIPNIAANAQISSFTLGDETTRALLGASNLTFNTEPIDLMIGAACYAFHDVFPERCSPSIFYESHGRNSWDPAIDPTNTVGWFTTLAPLYCGEHDEVKDYIIRAKDLRKRTPGQGWNFFCSRYHHEKGHDALSQYDGPEITLNYSGLFQQLDGEDSILAPFDVALNMESQALNLSPDAARIGLVDILITGQSDALQIHFVYNTRMKYQDRIQCWIKRYEQALIQLTEQLPKARKCLTLADMPLMPLDWDVLQGLEVGLEEAGIFDISQIEDIYPLSKLQEGMLFSQKKGEGDYLFYSIVEFTSKDARQPIDDENLLSAWHQVIDRHSALRTIFLDSGTTVSVQCQIVLKSPGVQAKRAHYTTANDAIATLETSGVTEFNPASPPHKLTLCTTDEGRVIAKLELDHKVIDGYSIGILIRDLSLAYDCRLDTIARPSYSDFVKYTQFNLGPDQLRHWSDYLEGAEPCYFPDLLDGKPDPTISGHGMARIGLGVDLAEVNGFCKNSDITLFSLLQVSWAVVLGAFTGSQDVCFGYLSVGRDAAVTGIEDMVGPVISMMICRLKIDPEVSISAILQDCQSNMLKNLQFQHVALADIHHALGLSGNALFNTVLSLQKSKDATSVGSIHAHRHSGTDPTEYAMAVDITTSSHSVEIQLEYELGRISPGMAENVASAFAQVVRSISTQATSFIKNLDLISPSNLSDILSWIHGDIDLVDSRIDHIITAQSLLYPNKDAIVGWDGHFTYSELEHMTDLLASHLVSKGVLPGIIVPFCFEKSVWTIVAMLATLKAGGACAALDPEYPRERLKGIIIDAKATLIICSPSQRRIAEELVDQIVILDSEAAESLAIEPRARDRIGSAKDAAFVQFTSGSTGKPKGIIIEHRAMATSAKAHGRAMHMDDTTRTIQFASYTFDNSVEEIFTTLQHGGTVCVSSESERLHDIGAAMARYGVTWADLTPTVASLIQPEEVPSLKTLCLGGEAVNQDVVDTWAGKVELINGYGPAEACVTCICSTEDLSGPIRSTNIGVGVGCNTWVVDPRDENRLAPVGTVGELLIEGPILARGYLNDSDKTDAAFITNPTWAVQLQPGVDRQLYKTNDLVRYTSQGSLIFIGRSDSQVKIRGQRVELGDIEWNLSSFEGVEKAIVIWPRQGQCSSQLIAVVTLKGDDVAIENVPTLTIRRNREAKAVVGSATEWLSERLPSYMVPQVWAVVNSIPLLPSGKLNRKSVIAWVDEMDKELFNQLKLFEFELDDSGETATTPAQQDIRLLCADLLNKTPGEIILSRSFMGHGGDSISAMKLSAMARKAGWAVSVQSILRAKSLAGIASEAKPAQTTMRKMIKIKKVLLLSYPLSRNCSSTITQRERTITTRALLCL